MDSRKLLDILSWLEGDKALPPPSSEELAEAARAGFAAQEEEAGDGAEEVFEALRKRASHLGTKLRELRQEAAGRPAGDEVWDRIQERERELSGIRARLLDEAAARQRRGEGGAAGGPRYRLTWRGRELRDELLARAWRLEGVPAAALELELQGLRGVLRDRAAGAARVLAVLDKNMGLLDPVDRRAAALSLALAQPFPELEADRCAGLTLVVTRLMAQGFSPPSELAVLIALHEHRNALLALPMATTTPLSLLANALLPGAPEPANPSSEAARLIAQAGVLSLARRVVQPGPSDLVLAASGLDPARLALRPALIAALDQSLDDPDLLAAISALLLMGSAPDDALFPRWKRLSDALSALHDGPVAVPAALLTLLQGPPEELLDDLRLAAEEIERADLAVSGLEILTQGVRLLLAAALDPTASRLLPASVDAATQGRVGGLSVVLPAALAGARVGVLLDAAIYSQARRSFFVYHSQHPVHRSSGFHG